MDGVDWHGYAKDLDANLSDLLERLKTHRYRAKMIRRKYIPKASGKLRPLGIPTLEDKIVQMSVRRLLEAIFEPDFLDNSMGYRPNRGAREASQKLRDELFFGRVHWIVEADIKGFFDHMDHDWLIRMLEERIADSHFIRLIRKWLRLGILEEDGSVINPTTGTPQGGIVSPVLANIYLHHVLDLWVERVVKKRCRGQVVYQRYADDFVVGFEYGDEAKGFFAQLPERLTKFCLGMAADKSGIVRFSRCDLHGSKRFVYLGFDFYWARTRSGKLTVKRRTNTKKFQQSLQSLKVWINSAKSKPLKELALTLRSKLAGHFNYYGVIGNSRRLSEFFNAARHTIYRALNSRSQKKSYSWDGFKAMWKTLDIPNPKIVETNQSSPPMLDLIKSLHPLRDSTEEPCAGIPHAGICEGAAR